MLRTSILLRLALWRNFSGIATRIGEMSTPRKPTAYQLDLFSKPSEADTTETPQLLAAGATSSTSNVCRG